MSLRIIVSGVPHDFESPDADELIRQLNGGIVVRERKSGDVAWRSPIAELLKRLEDAWAKPEPFEPSVDERATLILALDVWSSNARKRFPESAKALRHTLSTNGH